jgi:hypothetical protein
MECLGNLTVVLAQLVQPMDLSKELLCFLLFHRRAVLFIKDSFSVAT